MYQRISLASFGDRVVFFGFLQIDLSVVIPRRWQSWHVTVSVKQSKIWWTDMSPDCWGKYIFLKDFGHINALTEFLSNIMKTMPIVLWIVVVVKMTTLEITENAPQRN